MSTVGGMSRPPILFLLSDQHHAGFLGAAGHPVVRTPHLDALAGAGVSMDRLYCPSPLCVPSRMAMLSGLLPSATGIYTNLHSLPSEQPTFVHSLRAAGYRTTLCGRMHFNGPDQRHGFTERLVGDITAVDVNGRSPDYGALQGSSGQSRTGVELSGPGNSNVLEYDRAVTRAAVDYVSGHNGEEPLFLTVGFYGPHCPFVCPPDLFDYYYERVAPPEEPDGFRSAVHPFIRKWYANRRITEPDPEAARRCLAAYCGLVEVMDRHVGAILEAWRSNPALRDGLVVYASDHGEMAGEKGMFWKSSFYEGSVRVPCIAHLPGAITGGRRCAHAGSLLDLGPTFLDWGGGAPLPHTHGASLRGVWTGQQPDDTERPVFSLLGDIKGDAPGAMVRWGRWKMMRYHGYDHPQLFDLEKDPGEWNDRGSDPAAAHIREELDTLLEPHWHGAEVAAEVERIQALQRYWEDWKQSVDHDSPERWKEDPEENYLV